MNAPAAIVLFAYKRLDHTKRVIESILKADLGEVSKLIIVSDGYKEEQDKAVVETIRTYVKTLLLDKNIELLENEYNKGLAFNIRSSLDTLFQKYERLIVLEDDIEISEGTLQYFNDALKQFEQDKSVYHISAFFEPIVNTELEEYFFLPITSCWGWATWKDRWLSRERDAYDVLNTFYKKSNWEHIRKNMPYDLLKDVICNCEGSLNTWASAWALHVYNQNGKVLVPNQSLVRNIGHDDSGTNSDSTDIFKVESCKSYVGLPENINYSLKAYTLMKAFYCKQKPSLKAKLKAKLKAVFPTKRTRFRFMPHTQDLNGEPFHVIDIESFSNDIKIYEMLPFSKEGNKAESFVDFYPNEGALAKLMSDQSLVDVSKSLNKTLLRQNLTNAHFAETEELMINANKADWMRCHYEQLDTLEIGSQNGLIIHFTYSLENESLAFEKPLEAMSEKYNLLTLQYGIEEFETFRRIYRKQIRKVVIAIRK